MPGSIALCFPCWIRPKPPGVTVSVVHDGELLTARGYGSSDRATRLHDCATPVDPERQLFRIGSVSKLFTAVSAMPLVGEGQLGLDADVQKYLDFDSTHPGGTVTARHLLTHRWLRGVHGRRLHSAHT